MADIDELNQNKELRATGDGESVQHMRVDIAKGWSAEQAAERAKADVDYHALMVKGGDQGIREFHRQDMATSARESSDYREALEQLAPALLKQAQQEAAAADAMLEERKRREALMAAAGLSADAAADAFDRVAADKSAENSSQDVGGEREADRDHITGRDVAAGAAHVAQLAEVGGPAALAAAQAVGVADAAKVAADVASGKDVRALDVATAAASVTMTAGVGGAAVQAGAKAVAAVGALDAGQRAINTAEDSVSVSDEVRAVLKNPLSPEDGLGDIQSRRWITANHDSIKGMAQNSLSSEQAAELAMADAKALRGITNQDERHAAAVMMAANVSSQSAYKEQLMRQDPGMALEVEAITGEPVVLNKPVSEADKERERQEAAAAASATTAALASPAAAGKAADRADDMEDNAVGVQRKGAELERGEFIMPRRITQAYTELDGKFFAKDTSRMMFHDQGEKLATSTTDKAAIADMVAYAKAKQWESLKLTGSQEFRREAWLQAESQGIKTQGFTPREKDLVELKALTMERSTNSITPLQDRSKDRKALEQPIQAPRHDLNKNQAASASAASQNNTTNIKELQKDPAMARFSMEDLSKIAFYRALLIEREKGAPETVRDEAIAKFDKSMRDPAMVKALPDPEVKGEQQAAAKEKTQKLTTPEHTL